MNAVVSSHRPMQKLMLSCTLNHSVGKKPHIDLVYRHQSSKGLKEHYGEFGFFCCWSGWELQLLSSSRSKSLWSAAIPLFIYEVIKLVLHMSTFYSSCVTSIGFETAPSRTCLLLLLTWNVKTLKWTLSGTNVLFSVYMCLLWRKLEKR